MKRSLAAPAKTARPGVSVPARRLVPSERTEPSLLVETKTVQKNTQKKLFWLDFETL